MLCTLKNDGWIMELVLGRGYGDGEGRDENFWLMKSYTMILGN
jgi:hypothetical protein